MRHSLVLRVVWLCWLGGFFAQLNADPISVKFQSMGLGFGIGNLSYKSGGRYVALTLDVYIPSKKVYTYSGDNPMVLYGPAVVQGEDEMVPVGRVQFTEGKSFLVIVAQQNANAYVGEAVPIDGPDFPPNSVRILNLTPVKLEAVCNNKMFALAPGRNGIFGVGSDQQYTVVVAAPRNGQMKQVNAASDKIAPGSRLTLFLTMANSKQYEANPHIRPMIDINAFDEGAEGNGSSAQQE
jgi:hypothetical protein